MACYRYLDRDVVPGEPWIRYLLVEVEASGRRLSYGPYDVDTRRRGGRVDADADDGAIADTAAADATLLDQGDSRTPRHRRLPEAPACPTPGRSNAHSPALERLGGQDQRGARTASTT